MGINHSNLYKIFMESKEKAEENIYSIILEEGLDFFTKDDIVSFCNDEIYKNLFETKILVNCVDIIYNRFTNEEYYNILIRATHKLKQKMFLKLIKEYEKNKETLNILRGKKSFSKLFKEYSVDIILRKYINNEENLLEYLKKDDIKYLIRNQLKYLHKDILEKFINQIKNNNIYLEEVFKNIECTSEFLIIIKAVSDTLYYNSLIRKYHNKIYSLIYNIDINQFKNSNYKYVLEQIISELLEITDSKLEDIEYIKKGATSKVYRIENLVLKTGNSRFVYEIPNHNRILHPLLRRKIGDLYIEVSDFVDTKNIPDDDVYIIFKELMDSGLTWLDPRKENIGRILKDDSSYGIYVNEKTVGLIGKNHFQRKKGELVIIDTDLIFYTYNIPWDTLYKNGVNFRSYNKMMDRYVKEKTKTKIKYI